MPITSEIYSGISHITKVSTKVIAADADADANANAYAYADGSASAGSNTVTVSETGSTGNVYGGYAAVSAVAVDAKVGTATAYANPNAEANAEANANAEAQVEANGSSASAGNNTVTVSETGSTGNVYGGYTAVSAVAADAEAGTSKSTSNPYVFDDAYASAYADGSSASANNNRVDIRNSAVNGFVYGGYASVTAAGGTAKGGTAKVGRGSADGDTNWLTKLGTATVSIEYTKLSASDNQVTFNGTLGRSADAVAGDIVGGKVVFDITQGTATNGNGTDEDNSVNTTGTSASATENTVTTGKDAVILNPDSSIYGGLLEIGTYEFTPGSVDVRTGNTLNFYAKPVTVKNVDNFEYYNFYIPSGVSDGDTLITATGSVDLSGATVSLKSIAPSVLMPQNGQITMIDAATLTTDDKTSYVNNASVYQGVSFVYDTTVEKEDSDKVGVTFNGRSVNKAGTKPLLEGPLAGLAFLNQGQDLAIDRGIRSAMASPSSYETPLSFFGTFSGSSQQYSTDSHLDVDGFSIMAGLAWKQQSNVLGAFFESGWATYDSRNSFENQTAVYGKGNTRYYGFGLLGRHTLNNGTYFDGTVCIGRVETDFGSKGISEMTGQNASYNSKTAYYGASIGIGRQWDIGDTTRFDTSAKYLWARQGSDSVTVGGDPIRFGDTNSHRIRMIGRFYKDAAPQLTLMAGLGYEYEFDGKQEGTTYGSYAINTSELKGGYAIGELGFTAKPSEKFPISIDALLRGYAGKREGLGATVQFRYAF